MQAVLQPTLGQHTDTRSEYPSKPQHCSLVVELDYRELMSPSLTATVKSNLIFTLAKQFPELDSKELCDSVGREMDKFQDRISTDIGAGGVSPAPTGCSIHVAAVGRN